MIYEFPCGDLCDGDGAVVDPVAPSPGPNFDMPEFTGEYENLGCAADAEEPERVRMIGNSSFIFVVVAWEMDGG